MNFTAGQIADQLDGTIVGNRDVDINALSKIEEARKGSLTFLANPKYTEYIYSTDASATIVSNDFQPTEKITTTLIKVKDPYSSFTTILELFNGDKIESYLLFSNPHQYGKSIDVRFSPIRVVCNNTLTMALNGKVGVSLDHRKAFDAQTVQQTLGLAKESMDEYKEVAEFLGSKRYTKDSLNNYFADVFGKSSKSEKDNVILTRNGQRALEVIDTQPGANYQKGTFWQALNAVTYMTDHELANTRDNRVHSAWFGGNRVKKINAVKKAVEYAQAA